VAWTSKDAPTVAQFWLLTNALFQVYYNEEQLRLKLSGAGVTEIAEELAAVGLAIPHPTWGKSAKSLEHESAPADEILLLRAAFWQGAGSPFGNRPAWLPPSTNASRWAFPYAPVTSTITTRFPDERVHTIHPRRPAKPKPGSLIYSRYIPHLDEHFTMTALDYTDPTHLQLFHTWQNDPRVAAGWNETGTLDQHRTYLKNLHDDPHVLTMLASFEDVPFAYFEVYWAKEDHMGAHHNTGDFDRGRHSLVGNTAFRGPHRAHAWWSSLMHYMFLDDPRTMDLTGEPKWTNDRVLELDALHGFHVEKWIDLGHKRSAYVRCSRERYFQLATVGKPWEGKDKRRPKPKASKL
jgi:hypothetical protein